MNKMRHICLIASVVVFVIVGSGCSTKKLLTPSVPLQDFTAEELIEKVDRSNFEFDNIQAKLNVKIETKDDSHSLKGHLKMKQDSIIWVSISIPMGAEVIRTKITSDSIYFMNKNDKLYYIDNINALERLSPMVASLRFIQSVLVGNDINLKNSDNCVVLHDKNQYKLYANEVIPSNNNDVYIVLNKELSVEPTLFKISEYKVRKNNDKNVLLDLEYADFEQVNDKYLPTKIIMNLYGNYNITLSIDYSGVSTNDKGGYNFKIPKKYERIYLDE